MSVASTRPGDETRDNPSFAAANCSSGPEPRWHLHPDSASAVRSPDAPPGTFAVFASKGSKRAWVTKRVTTGTDCRRRRWTFVDPCHAQTSPVPTRWLDVIRQRSVVEVGAGAPPKVPISNIGALIPCERASIPAASRLGEAPNGPYFQFQSVQLELGERRHDYCFVEARISDPVRQTSVIRNPSLSGRTTVTMNPAGGPPIVIMAELTRSSSASQSARDARTNSNFFDNCHVIPR